MWKNKLMQKVDEQNNPCCQEEVVSFDAWEEERNLAPEFLAMRALRKELFWISKTVGEDDAFFLFFFFYFGKLYSKPAGSFLEVRRIGLLVESDACVDYLFFRLTRPYFS